MSQNLTLKNLNDAVNAVFRWKQRAWETKNEAIKSLHDAKRIKQEAFEARKTARKKRWDIRKKNDSLIRELNKLIDEEYGRKRNFFDKANLAYIQNRHHDAKDYSDRGHECSRTIRDFRSEREELLGEIRQARKAVESAEADFEVAKHALATARIEYERAREDFESAKAAHSVAQEEFNRILREIKAINIANRLAIAKTAGVPVDYLYEEMIYIKTKYDGQIDIFVYPGGSHGDSDGDDHGHYVLDHESRLVYARPPGTPHGSHNYVQ